VTAAAAAVATALLVVAKLKVVGLEDGLEVATAALGAGGGQRRCAMTWQPRRRQRRWRRRWSRRCKMSGEGRVSVYEEAPGFRLGPCGVGGGHHAGGELDVVDGSNGGGIGGTNGTVRRMDKMLA
jgi:hypothetical protein